jgi:hypothetical protein
VNEKVSRQLVRRRSAGACEVCGLTQATEYQHRKNRSQGGLWTPSNALDVCHSCHHTKIHGNPARAYQMGWSVRQAYQPHQMPAFVWVDPWGPSWVWLDDTGGFTYLTDEEILVLREVA